MCVCHVVFTISLRRFPQVSCSLFVVMLVFRRVFTLLCLSTRVHPPDRWDMDSEQSLEHNISMIRMIRMMIMMITVMLVMMMLLTNDKCINNTRDVIAI